MEIIDYSQEGLPIYYDQDNDTVKYKDNSVSFNLVKRAIQSSNHRVRLDDKLYMVKTPGFVEFGCLVLNIEKVNILIKQICNK